MRSCFFSRSGSWECSRPWTSFFFYVFFELTLVPMYFIIGIWGGERRVYAAIKFFLYTAVGSLLMLVGILYIYVRGKVLLGVASFAFVDLLQIPLTPVEQMWLFGAFALAFAIKVPLFPFHTWLPDAHVEAPTPGVRRAGGGPAQDGDVRVRAIPVAVFSPCGSTSDGGDAHAHAGCCRYHLRVMGGGRSA